MSHSNLSHLNLSYVCQSFGMSGFSDIISHKLNALYYAENAF